MTSEQPQSSAFATPGPSRAIPAAVNSWSAEYLDALYAQFKADPSSLAPDMRAFFQGFDLGVDRPATSGAALGVAPSSADMVAQKLTALYRTLGHKAASLDPLKQPRKPVPALDPATHGFTDLSAPVAGGGTLGDVVARLKAAYSGTTGAEFMHCDTPEEREWFIARFEGPQTPAAPEQQKQILTHLTASETFEKWLQKRYQGKKRFSLEGGETLIPMMKLMTDHAAKLGVKEIILGMAHRGRLNVLRHYLGKSTERIITEFEDSWSEGLEQGGGDVKYHRGSSYDQETPSGTVHISMLNNPSHLESVNALVTGRARARQEHFQTEGAKEGGTREVAALLIHGDAAISGQGVVAECLNMAYLEGYSVGGTLHLVINNQVGFTTDPTDDRSTEYCTDLAKMIHAPVLHVNADDPEACVRAAIMAIDYRDTFKKDIFVDVVCFRRYGHNEQDEPGYTQPALYALVRAHPGTRAVYAAQLAAAGVVTAAQAEAMVEAESAGLDKAQDSAKAAPVNPVTPPGLGRWTGFIGKYTFESPKTAVDMATLEAVCAAMGRTPEGFNVHPKLKETLDKRSKLPMTKKLHHADSEQIAIGTMLLDGTPVRLSGQDSRRGTFSSRHAVARDEKTGERHTFLNHIKKGQAVFNAWDSPLSEYSVMGFDYGYARANPHCLVMWEGQFGDFCNTAQVIIDQYMAASEVKWDRWAGLCLLLPHGYEGQGPEHSSARLERFLQLCADDNMEVVYPSTGAQVFHMLRRHVKRNFRKPLIVMTPKKFLRVETSTIDELTTGSFQHLIDDPMWTGSGADLKQVKKVIYCSGKFYHEMNERRQAIAKKDTAIIRIEQLYPFHVELARQINARYPADAQRLWVQEEPRNQGAFMHVADVMRDKLKIELTYKGREASASPATGSEHAHKKQQEKILSGVIGPMGPMGEPAKPGAPSGNGSPMKVEPRETPSTPMKSGQKPVKATR
ncbi:MAG: 2-oxoglutarate dehydrogenase E1 component [Planctomycetota bacterium]